MRYLALSVCILLFPVVFYGQEVIKVGGRGGNIQPRPNVLPYEIVNGDTVYLRSLKEVTILEPRVFSRKEDQKQYDKLIRSVRKTLPLAREAKKKLDYYEFMMAGQDKKERKATLKLMESQLRKEFGDQVKNLNKRDAAVLFKLIDRETENSTYELLKDLKGGFNAFFYQLAAKSFKLDLKSEYDPAVNTYDKYIEEIVYMLDQGRL